MATFAEQRATDAAEGGAFLNTNDFGQSWTYKPKDGRERTLVLTNEPEATERDSADGIDRIEVIRVLVRIDSEDGIDNPQLGDALRLSSDPPGMAYSFNGGRSDVGELLWVLEFERVSPLVRGGNRRQR